jgi:DNA-binding response OmpR family regulator
LRHAFEIRVLVVEDSPTDVALLQLALKQVRVAKFEFVVETRVADACQRLGSEEFDLVMTDLGLPDGFGLDTYRRIREAARGRPVIVLTGDDDSEKGALALREGAQGYLVKGQLSARALIRAVQHALEERRQPEEAQQSQRLDALGQPTGDVAQALDDAAQQPAARRSTPD